MTGIALVLFFIVAVAAMVWMISRWKVHPFFAIMGVSLLIALVAGIPLAEIPKVTRKKDSDQRVLLTAIFIKKCKFYFI